MLNKAKDPRGKLSHQQISLNLEICFCYEREFGS